MSKLKKEVAVSDSQKRAVAALRSAEEKRIYEDMVSVGVYVPRLRGAKLFGVPFYAKSDSLASQAFRSCLEMEPSDTTLVGSDLFCIGKFRFDTAKLTSVRPRLIAY